MSDIDNPQAEGRQRANPTSKMARRPLRARAARGFHQWLLSGNTATTVQRHLESETENLDKQIDRSCS